MAERAGQIARAGPGLAAAAFVAAAILGPLGAVIWRAGAGFDLGPSDWAAINFTVKQALISALISVMLAIPVARALARRNFFGRGVLVTLLGAPFILPVIVAVLGLLSVFGRSGLLNSGLSVLGLPEVQIYGLHGVVLAHVFFNLPLATRVIFQGWQSIPAERFRLAASLDMQSRDIAKVLERPMLRATVPGAFLVVFALCLSSFAVALTLGGGPRATTIELAIYQAFRFDFDLSRAATLAVIQLVLVVAVALAALRYGRTDGLGAGMDRSLVRWDAQGKATQAWDGLILCLISLFLLLPMAMILWRGLPALFELPKPVWQAAFVSVKVALGSMLLCLFLSLSIGIAAVRLRGLDAVSILGIAASPLVIGTGVFLLLNPFVVPSDFAMFVTMITNALTALPFALRSIAPEIQRIEQRFGPLADSLGMRGWSRMRFLLLPRLSRPLGFAAGLSAALSLGDLGVVALFAAPEQATLPLQMYRLMGSYQMDAAHGAAVLLLMLSLAAFWVFDRGGRLRAGV